MTKIYCAVAIKLYYSRLRDFSAWKLSSGRRWMKPQLRLMSDTSLSPDPTQINCHAAGKIAANSEIVYVIVTESWLYKYIQTALLLCVMYIWFTGFGESHVL